MDNNPSKTALKQTYSISKYFTANSCSATLVSVVLHGVL